MCDRLVVTLPLVLCVLQHYKQPELYATILHYMNTTFTGLFSIECMMKIHAYGFRVSTQGKLQMQVAPSIGQGWLFFEAYRSFTFFMNRKHL